MTSSLFPFSVKVFDTFDFVSATDEYASVFFEESNEIRLLLLSSADIDIRIQLYCVHDIAYCL